MTKNRNNKEDEIWVTLKQGGNTYNRYEISNYGRVWDLKTDRESPQTVRGKPQYKYVNLAPDGGGERKGRRVNNIMGWSFLGDPPTPEHTVDHIDQDKFNNHLSNLRWASRRKQMNNRSNTVICEDGKFLSDKILEYKKQYEDDSGSVETSMSGLYNKYRDFELCIKYRQYFLKYGYGWYFEVDVPSGNKYKLVELCDDFGLDYLETKRLINSGLSFIDIVHGYTYIKPQGFEGIEYKGCWYKNQEHLNSVEGCVSYVVFLDRLRKGMTTEEALTYKHDAIWIDGFYMTKKEHCERLCVSYPRVTNTANKFGIPFEVAIKQPIIRVNKYNINGVTKDKYVWVTSLGIQDFKTFNSYVCRFNRTLRDGLEHFGVDTSDMIIYPCDGEVVQYNKPI